MNPVYEPEGLREVEVELDGDRRVIQQFDRNGNMVGELWVGRVKPEPEPDPLEEVQTFLVDAQGNPLAEDQAHLATHRVFRRCYDGKPVSQRSYPLAGRN